MGFARSTLENHSVWPRALSPTTGPLQIFWQPTFLTFGACAAFRNANKQSEFLHFVHTHMRGLATMGVLPNIPDTTPVPTDPQ